MSLPWVVSLWVEPPAKYWIWAAALALDLVLVTLRGAEDGDLATARLQRKVEHDSRGGRTVPTMVSVQVNRSHLDERLGLFVIIMLGEAVILLVHDAYVHEWTRPFIGTAVGCYVLLFGLWRMTFDHGFTGAPHTSLADLPPRFGLPLHLMATTGLLFIAAALAELLPAAGHEVERPLAWLLAVGLALHFGVGLIAGILGHAPVRWLVWVAGLSTAWSLLIGVVAPLLHSGAVVWVAALPAVWQASAGRFTGEARSAAEPIPA